MSSEPPLLVVVTGAPGAGKTTVAAAVRDRLGVPLIAKDTIKETLGEQLGVTARDDSQRLGSAVFALVGTMMRELLAHGVSLVVEGNFRADTNVFDGLPDAQIVQIHVTAPPATLRDRMQERGPNRHPVHYDADVADEVATRAARGEWEPLPLAGELIRIDTSTAPDVDAVLAARLPPAKTDTTRDSP